MVRSRIRQMNVLQVFLWAFEVFLRHWRDSNESTEELMDKGLAIQPQIADRPEQFSHPRMEH